MITFQCRVTPRGGLVAPRPHVGKGLACLLFCWVLAATACSSTQSSGHGRQTGAATPSPEGRKGEQTPPAAYPARFSHVQLLSRHDWVVADLDSIWRTGDAGRTWTRVRTVRGVNKGGKYTGGMSFVDGQTGFAVLDGQLLRSTDGGNSWADVKELDFGVHNIFFISARQGWAAGTQWAENPERQDDPLQGAGIWRTLDGGLTWEKQRVEIQKADATRLGGGGGVRDVYFLDSNKGWAAGSGVLLRTENGGSNWKLINGNPQGDFKSVYFINPEVGWATWRDAGAFTFTRDGGRRWVAVDAPVQVNQECGVYFTGMNQGFILDASGELYASSDGGRSWEEVSLENEGARRPTDGHTGDAFIGRSFDGALVALWAGGDKNLTEVFISTDAGASWRVENR